ncbi:MAG TPA: TrkA family potassium uptake protein [Dehalococcoidia bacterium]|nr:TrkA family potassium uptake protein [Dehalococcoidia bacterium]
MKVVIMGCGRVGSELAAILDHEGHQVTVLDIDPDSFSQLPSDFRGSVVVGNGIDQDVLRRVGVGDADAFVAVTPGDNRNVMASQMAKHLFGVSKVVCRIFDPIREEMYRNLGMETIGPTRVVAGLMKEALEREPAETPAGEG